MTQEPKPCVNGCGKLIKNQGVHNRYCTHRIPGKIELPLFIPPDMPKVSQSSSADNHSHPPKAKILKEVDKSTVSTHDTSNKGSWWQRNISQKAKYAKEKAAPWKIDLPDPKFTDEGLSESERLKKFLIDAPSWTKYRPSYSKKLMVEMLNHGKTFAPCVFVGENRPARILYLPYEPEKNRLIMPGKGYYRTPTTGMPFFFHEDLMLPLINSPNLKDTFQLPGHVVESAYGSGLREGTLQNADKFLNEIKKYKLVCYLLAGISILLLVALLFTAYTYDSNYKHLASAYTNMSEVIYKKT